MIVCKGKESNEKGEIKSELRQNKAKQKQTKKQDEEDNNIRNGRGRGRTKIAAKRKQVGEIYRNGDGKRKVRLNKEVAKTT